MQSRIRINDVEQIDSRTAYEKFLDYVTNEKTSDGYQNTLRTVLCEFFRDIMKSQGVQNRAQEFIDRCKDDSDWGNRAMIKLGKALLERNHLPADHPDHYAGASLEMYISPVQALCESNDISLNWKKIRKFKLESKLEICFK